MAGLRMVPGTIDLFDAELAGDHAELARLLAVTAIDEWPPIGGEHDAHAVAFFRQALAAEPSLFMWQAFYVCVVLERNGFVRAQSDRDAHLLFVWETDTNVARRRAPPRRS